MPEAFRSTSFWSLSAAVSGVVALIIGGIVSLISSELDNFALGIVIIGAVLLALALVLSPRSVARFLVGRQGRVGTNVIIMTVAFFGIAVLVNFLMFRNPTRFDVTATRVFSLSPQTVQILQGLESDIRANAFFTDLNGVRAQAAGDILNEFSRQTNRFEFRFIDPELERSVAIKYNVTDYPAIVIENVDAQVLQSVASPSEQQILTGVLVVTGVERKTIYNLTGHEELSLTRDLSTQDLSIEGFDLALEGLLRDNYAVKALNLIQTPEVPADAAVIIIAGPTRNLSQPEREALDRYLEGGGKLIALFDPGTPASFVELISRWGITMGGLSIADAASSVAGQVLTPLVQRANGGFTPFSLTGIGITNQIDVVFFPGVTSIEPVIAMEDMPPQVRLAPLAETTLASWLETDVENPRPDPGLDSPGPFAVGLVVEACAPIDAAPRSCAGAGDITKIVVFGDSDFAKNQYYSSSENSDLFLNSVNWLAEDFDLISIRPKFFPFRELVVTTREINFIKWSSWLLPPGLMLILGSVIWWRRR